MTYPGKYPAAPRKLSGNLVLFGRKIILWSKIMITFAFFLLVAVIIIAYAGFAAVLFAVARLMYKMRQFCSFQKKCPAC